MPPSRAALYGGGGALGAFVRVAGVRLAQTARRTRARQREDTMTDRLATSGDPERLVLRKEHAERLTDAVRAALSELDDQSNEALRCFYFESRSLEEIATLLRVSRATAARRVAHARERVLNEARRHLKQAAGMRADEAESMLRWMTSNFEMGLSMALGRAAD
jgi:RNA polymerase sigma-70 factor (ECF subfamily)